MGITKRIRKHPVQDKKPRGRPPKTRTIYHNINMDYIKKNYELRLDGNISENWRVFWQNFEVFGAAIELSKKEDVVKPAILLNALGPEAIEVFNSLDVAEEKKKKYDDVVKAFQDFCKPKTIEVYESFVFHSRKQGAGEPFDQFLIDLKKIVRKCGFKEQENRMLRDRIGHGVRDINLQKRLLETENLTSEKAVEMARAAEASSEQMKKTGRASGSVIGRSGGEVSKKGE